MREQQKIGTTLRDNDRTDRTTERGNKETMLRQNDIYYLGPIQKPGIYSECASGFQVKSGSLTSCRSRVCVCVCVFASVHNLPKYILSRTYPSPSPSTPTLVGSDLLPFGGLEGLGYKNDFF